MNFRVGDLVKIKDSIKLGELRDYFLPITTHAFRVTKVTNDGQIKADDGYFYPKEFLEIVSYNKDNIIDETIEYIHQSFKDGKMCVGLYADLCNCLRCEPQVSDEDEVDRCNQ